MTVGPEQIRLDGRVAVVTGAGQGIGAATARTLARFGADVAVCDRNGDTLAITASAIDDEGRRSVRAVIDVRDGEAVESFLALAARELGPIDIIVNNVGGGFHAEFADISPNGEAALIAENFTTVTNTVRHGVPLMSDGGAIVNVTSVEAHHAAPGFAVYAAMKAAVEQLTKTLALELGGRGIRVNAVAPDMIPTPGDDQLAADSGALSDSHFPTPMRRVGTADECAGVIAFLASDLAAFVTGASIPVDGGTTAGGAWKVARDGRYVI